VLAWRVVAACVLFGSIAARGETLRVGIDPAAPPLTYLDESGQPKGFAVALLESIARDEGFELQFVTSPWPEILAGLREGKIDVLANASMLANRETFMDFAVAHLELRAGVFYRKSGLSIRRLSDLSTLRVGVSRNSRTYDYAVQEKVAAHLMPFDSIKDAMAALDRGDCDAVIATSLIARQIIRDFDLSGIVDSELDVPGVRHQLRMAVPAGRAKLLFKINDGLARLRVNGTYDRLYKQWIGPLEPRHLRMEDLRPYLPLAVLVAAAVAGAFFWQRRLVRRLARQAEVLRESQERLSLVLEGSEDGFWDWDMRTGRIERSARWASMIGYSVAEIEANIEGGRALVHPDDLAEYDELQERLNRAETDRYDIEYRMRAKSGSWRWIHDRGKVVARQSDRTPLRMAGTHTDITQRKQTEAALFESQALLRRSAQLLEQTQAAAHIGGWELDLRTDQMYWTRETYRIYETSPEEFKPSRSALLSFYLAESRNALAAAIDQVVQHGTPFALDLDLHSARGRAIRVHAIGAADVQDGAVVKIYGSFRDITSEHAAEQDREKLRLKMLDAQKLESLGVLAGGIAHDFNNLLTVILANASFAREDGHAGDERLANIEIAARRAADLCRQMLAYAGKGTFLVERIDLATLVRETAQLLRVSISKKARLELTLAADLPPVGGDVSQLRQVVMNLVINASDALGDSPGDIYISARRARPEAPTNGVIHSFDLPAGECICLEVSDTGHGMSPATLARIFDPFFTTKFAGRGLGLAAVLGIVRAHRGALTVQSELGCGSTFRLFLPTAAPAHTPVAPALPRASAANRPAPGATVLIADDEDGVLDAADSVLRHAGYNTVLAHNGIEAVAKFSANPSAFAVVLFDLTMPGLDGAEVLRAIRTINTTTPALVMSGFSEQDVFERLGGLGDVAIVRKPFTRETLVSRVSEVLGGHPHGSIVVHHN
jgi:two-component system, cell cycle sensor histidine kinase and response regulator CckA